MSDACADTKTNAMYEIFVLFNVYFDVKNLIF